MNSIFQTPEWEKFKLATGYSKSYWIEDVLILQKELPLKRTMLYSPMVNKNKISNFISQNYLDKIKQIAKEEKSIFYRLELNIPIIYERRNLGIKEVKDEKTEENKVEQNSAKKYDTETDRLINQLTNYKFIKSFEEMQPEYTLILDIQKNDVEILGQMKPKGRYNIKVAQKHNVIVKKTRNVDRFYELYQETAKRQRISFRDKRYFKNLVDILEPKGYCEVFEASVDKLQIPNLKQDDNTTAQSFDSAQSRQSHQPIDKDTTLASAIVTFYKGRATYLFGASSEEMRNVMTPYALHWEIIKEAKQRHCDIYDFFGIAPPDKPGHPWSGVTRFKKQFGGEEEDTLGSYDLIFKPFEYKIFKMAEKIRR